MKVQILTTPIPGEPQHELYMEPETEKDHATIARLLEEFTIIGFGRDPEHEDKFYHVRLPLRRKGD